jgi:hypothetical protein
MPSIDSTTLDVREQEANRPVGSAGMASFCTSAQFPGLPNPVYSREVDDDTRPDF